MKKKRRPGRPLKHKNEPLSAGFTFRLRPRIADLLREAAILNNKTASQEIEHRLERSFYEQQLLKDIEHLLRRYTR